MFRKILLPVDFSAKNQPAIDVALELAQSAGGDPRAESIAPAEVDLLHVVETIEHIDFSEMEDFYRKLEARAAAQLAVLAERFGGAGVRARQDVLFGRRAETILKHAAELGSDLIVLSSFVVDRE